MRLRDGWAANNRAPGHDKEPTVAADAPAILINWRLVSPPLRVLADDRLLFFDIIAPFCVCRSLRRTLLSDESLEVNARRLGILFLDKAAHERLHER